MGYQIGIDVGGTFTDLLVCDDDGRTRICKSPTTPADPSLGVFTALERAAQGTGFELRDFLADVDAIVERPTTTIVLPGDTGLSCDQWGNYLLEKAV